MKNIVFYPFLLSLFPILALYEHNKDQLKLFYLTRPLLISFLSSVIIYWLAQKIIKDKHKSAIITSFFIIIFFAFNHYSEMIPDIASRGKTLIPGNYLLLLLWILMFFTLTALIISTKRDLNPATKFLNTVALVLIIMPLVNIGLYEWRAQQMFQDIEAKSDGSNVQNDYRPDIYYIIFDAYGRADVLKEIYDYDNSNFTKYLAEKNFYVADKSQSNYPQTFFSISSSLNLEYLNYLSEKIGEDSSDRRPLREMMKNNKVYDLLKNRGYQFVVLPPTWNGVYKNLKGDIFLNDHQKELNDFEKMLLPSLKPKSWTARYREKILNNFKIIPELTKYNFPTFTYVHFLTPHPPFIFDRNGNPLDPTQNDRSGFDGDHYFAKNPDKDDYKKKYIDEIIFLNGQIKIMVEEILNKSKEPPIIIIQSDHGPGSMTYWEDPEKTNMKERMSILNAYYLPSECKNALYNSITPVNTFRVIFNCLFQANFEILKDESYFNTWSQPYKFIKVTEKILK